MTSWMGWAAALFLALAAGADEVHLEQGGAVRGTIVKETAEQVFVDIGHTILAIPRSEIESITRGQPEPVETPPADPHRLWIERSEPLRSVRENVERIGEGVALVRVPGALGSGFVVRPDGWVVTNAHVINGERNVSVTIYRDSDEGFDQVVFERVEISAVNPVWDLALLKIPEEELGDQKLVAIPFGQMSELRQGETVFAMGSPLGLVRSVSEGIVSKKNRASGGLLYIQTTAAINPGNSGGPLLDLHGQVVGVNSWLYLDTEGLNFAIPIATVKVFLENRDAFAYDKDNPANGVRYLPPPEKRDPGQ